MFVIASLRKLEACENLFTILGNISAKSVLAIDNKELLQPILPNEQIPWKRRSIIEAVRKGKHFNNIVMITHQSLRLQDATALVLESMEELRDVPRILLAAKEYPIYSTALIQQLSHVQYSSDGHIIRGPDSLKHGKLEIDTKNVYLMGGCVGSCLDRSIKDIINIFRYSNRKELNFHIITNMVYSLPPLSLFDQINTEVSLSEQAFSTVLINLTKNLLTGLSNAVEPVLIPNNEYKLGHVFKTSIGEKEIFIKYLTVIPASIQTEVKQAIGPIYAVDDISEYYIDRAIRETAIWLLEEKSKDEQFISRKSINAKFYEIVDILLFDVNPWNRIGKGK